MTRMRTEMNGMLKSAMTSFVGLVVNARLSSVFCSSSWLWRSLWRGWRWGALDGAHFQPLLCTNWPMRGTTKKCAPMFFGSS